MTKKPELLTKREAMDRLEVSEKSIERYLKAGRLVAFDYQKPERGGRLMPRFTKEEVEKLRDELKNPPPAPIPSGRTDKPQTAMTARGAEAVETLALALRDAMGESQGGAVRLSERLLLNLAEASALTGLAESHLRDAAKAGELHARIVGRSWRVRPADLSLYVDALMGPVQKARAAKR